MFLDSAKKKEIFEKYGQVCNQHKVLQKAKIALFTVRIATFD